MAAEQELLGGAALQDARLDRAGALAGVEIGARRLGAAAGVDQRVAQLDAQLARARAILEREAIEARRAIEGQHLGRLRRRHLRPLAGALVVAGAAMVRRQRLGVGRAVGFERRRQPRVQPARLVAPMSDTTVSRMRSW